MMDSMLTYQDVAALCNVAVPTVYAWVCRKKIPHRRLSGRLVRFVPSEIESWLNARAVDAQSGRLTETMENNPAEVAHE